MGVHKYLWVSKCVLAGARAPVHVQDVIDVGVPLHERVCMFVHGCVHAMVAVWCGGGKRGQGGQEGASLKRAPNTCGSWMVVEASSNLTRS